VNSKTNQANYMAAMRADTDILWVPRQIQFTT